MSYTPDAVPEDTPPSLKAWLAEQMRRVSLELDGRVRVIPTGAEPARPRNGFIVYAVAPWATTLGAEGFYGYEAGSWVKL